MEPGGSLPHSQVPPPVPILSQIDPVHAPPPPHPQSHYLKLHLIILPLFLDLRSGLFPSGFPTKTMNIPLLSPIRATCPAYLILLDFITRIIMGEQY